MHLSCWSTVLIASFVQYSVSLAMDDDTTSKNTIILTLTALDSNDDPASKWIPNEISAKVFTDEMGVADMKQFCEDLQDRFEHIRTCQLEDYKGKPILKIRPVSKDLDARMYQIV